MSKIIFTTEMNYFVHPQVLRMIVCPQCGRKHLVYDCLCLAKQIRKDPPVFLWPVK